MSRYRGVRLLFVPVIATAFALAACEGDADEEPEETGVLPLDTATATVDTGAGATATATDTQPPDGTETATAEPTGTLSPPQPVDREGISFLVPGGWVGNADTWTSEESEVTLQFSTTEWEAPLEAETMLPEGAVNLDREEVETALGPVALHTIEVTDVADGPIYERHALLRTDERFYDWWLSAESVEALDEEQAVLDEILGSLEAIEDEGETDPLNPAG